LKINQCQNNRCLGDNGYISFTQRRKDRKVFFMIVADVAPLREIEVVEIKSKEIFDYKKKSDDN